MARYRFGPVFLAALLAHPAVQETVARPDGPSGGQPTADRGAAERLGEYKRAAGRYTIERHSDPPVTLALKPDPVFRWTSPLRTAYDGVMFVWIVDGRPEVAATFYRNIRDGVPFEQHEFQSLAASALTATYGGWEVWNAREAGLTLKPIPGAPPPAPSAAARLRQMHALSEEFRAETTDHKGTSPLRLLSHPLYRYEKGPSGPVDGAMFGFVHATDPEVLLLIEARPAGGSPAWHYGFARMSGFRLRAWHKDRPVWDVRSISSSYINIAAPDQPR
jgi:hypothetical protein